MTESRRPNRRDFLSGRAVTRLAQDAAQRTADTLAAEVARRPPAYLLHVGRAAMACEFEVMLNAGEHPHAPEAALRALDRVELLEDQLTVYRDHSEVSHINQLAADEPVEVESGLFGLLELALELGRETEGAFDITAGPLSKVWGFYRRAGRVPSEVELREALERVGQRHLRLNAERRTIQFDRPGMELNLGAIGKGYALDRCADALIDQGVSNFLIHGGSSSILGRGSRAGLPENETGWVVALRHPMRPEQVLAEIHLRDRALGTSGSGSQFFYHQGRRYGHILDPRSGHPAEQLISASVLAPDAARADALATAFFVLGVEGAEQYCARHPEVGALLVVSTKKAGTIDVCRLNLTDEDARLLPGTTTNSGM